jgi:hypothetical protein
LPPKQVAKIAVILARLDVAEPIGDMEAQPSDCIAWREAQRLLVK